MYIIKDRLEKIKATKQVARDKNMPFWSIALFDTIIAGLALTLIFSSFTSMGILIYFDNLDYKPYYADMLVMNNYWVIGLWAFGFFMISDKMVVVFINIHALKIKYMALGIQKLDMYFWRKTGKDAPVSNMLLKFQTNFMKLPKPLRFLFMMSGIILWGVVNLIY